MRLKPSFAKHFQLGLLENCHSSFQLIKLIFQEAIIGMAGNNKFYRITDFAIL